MSKREIIDSRELNIALNRLCCKLIENHGDFSNSILIGLQPRGAQVLQRIVQLLENEYKVEGVRTGLLDITFYRDDFRRREGHLQPNKTKIDFFEKIIKMWCYSIRPMYGQCAAEQGINDSFIFYSRISLIGIFQTYTSSMISQNYDQCIWILFFD